MSQFKNKTRNFTPLKKIYTTKYWHFHMACMFVWLLKITYDPKQQSSARAVAPALAWWSQVPSSCCSNFIMEPRSSVWKYCSLLFEEKLPTVCSWMSSLYLLLTSLVLIHTYLRSQIGRECLRGLIRKPVSQSFASRSISSGSTCPRQVWSSRPWLRPTQQGRTNVADSPRCTVFYF